MKNFSNLFFLRFFIFVLLVLPLGINNGTETLGLENLPVLPSGISQDLGNLGLKNLPILP